MELTLPIIISIISCVLAISTFVINRKDKAVKDVKDENSNQKLIEYRLTQLENKLDKVLNKLDSQDLEVKKMVKEEMEKHILQYHNRGE